MIITKQIVAKKLLSYMQHKITLENLVDWSENAIMRGKYQDNETKTLNEVLGRIGLSDVKAFGLFWDDCLQMMNRLGYKIKIEASLLV